MSHWLKRHVSEKRMARGGGQLADQVSLAEAPRLRKTLREQVGEDLSPSHWLKRHVSEKRIHHFVSTVGISLTG